MCIFHKKLLIVDCLFRKENLTEMWGFLVSKPPEKHFFGINYHNLDFENGKRIIF